MPNLIRVILALSLVKLWGSSVFLKKLCANIYTTYIGLLFSLHPGDPRNALPSLTLRRLRVKTRDFVTHRGKFHFKMRIFGHHSDRSAGHPTTGKRAAFDGWRGASQ